MLLPAGRSCAPGGPVATATRPSSITGVVNGVHLATSYSHQSRLAVRRGETVRAGELIGYIGSTGFSTGPHLHFEVYVEGRVVEPDALAVTPDRATAPAARLIGVPMSPRPSRRVLRAVAWVASAALGYAAGVATGSDREPGRQRGRPRQRPPRRRPRWPRHVGVLDEAADRIAARAAQHVQREDLERAAVEAMLARLDDTWSSYYRPSEFKSFQDALAGRYAGVGLWLRPAPAGGVEVASVQEGSPSSAAAIVPGEHVVGIDGVAVGASTVNTVASLLRGRGRFPRGLGPRAGPGRDGGHRRRSRGWRRCGCRCPPRATHSVVLDRVTFTAQDLAVERLGEDVLALTVSGFSRGVGRDVQRALATDSARHAGGVVLDLRDNAGGYLDEAVEVASAFLDGGRWSPTDPRRRHRRPLLDALPAATAPLRSWYSWTRYGERRGGCRRSAAGPWACGGRRLADLRKGLGAGAPGCRTVRPSNSRSGTT